MSQVIDKVKEKFPEYRDVPDEQLTLRIAEKYPQYLDSDPQFKADYQRTVAKSLTTTASTPAAQAPAESGAVFSMPESKPDRGVVGKAWDFLSHEFARWVPKPADLVEAARQFTASSLSTPGMKVTADQIMPKPTDESVAKSMHDSKLAAFTVGAAQGQVEVMNFFSSPIGAATLGMGALPRLAQRLIALGFTAQVVSQTPEIAKQLGEEFGKSEGQRDYKKIGNLTTQAVTTTGFSVMGALHGAAPDVKPDPALADHLRGVDAPATAAALTEQVQAEKGANALQQQATEVLQPVREQPGEGKREVPAEGTGAETGARGEQAAPEKTQSVIDWERYKVLKGSVKGKSLDDALPITREIEDIKSRYGGMPPPEPEVITHAAFKDDKGTTHIGANHPALLEKLGIEGFETRESRNTDQFGFWTSKGRFISREEAGPIATEAGQNLKTFEPGEPVHSDNVRSPAQPDQSLAEAPTQMPALGAKEGMGAAKYGEVPDVGEGGEKYGISQRVREERAQAGQVDPVAPGVGTNAQESIAHGRALNAADPELPERLLRQFESDPNRGISRNLTDSIRAHGETLARNARQVEQQFGTQSPEYEAARDALSTWDKRTKPISTEWHAIGEGHQGWTDLDTGSVAGLERERMRLTDKPFTPEEVKEAEKLTKDVREKEDETDKAAQAVNTELQEHASPERKLADEERNESDAVKQVNDLTEKVSDLERQLEAASKAVGENKARVKAGDPQAKATQVALDAASKVVREYAIARASAERRGRVKQAERDRDMARVQLDAAKKALAAAIEVRRKAAIQTAKAARIVNVRRELNEQSKAAQAALDAASKVVREWAITRAEAENKARVAKVVADRKVADIQVQAARKAEAAAMKRVIEAAQQQTALERKLLADPSIPVLEKARQYLDKDFVRFDDLRTKVAADLGMSVDKVTNLLARSKRMKLLTDDLWIKQQRERNTKTKAKLFVEGLDVTKFEKFLHGIPRTMFKIRVGLHGTVALGTHAPAVAFDPRFWGTYVRNFGKMYHMVGSRSFYEGQMQSLLRRKNYATALRGGLVVDPFKYEDFKYPGITSEAAGKISQAISKATGIDPKAFTGAGERGYSILKVLRQDMFDQHWDNLPRQMQTTEMAKAISDGVNHITGVVKTQAPFMSELALFAPKLQMSRAAFLFGDPLRAARTARRAAVRAVGERLGIERRKLLYVTPADQYFAVNELKTKVYALGTLGSLLALNQGILAMSGSDQKVNFTDPFKSDFGKFKVAGLNVSYGNPLITMARLPIRIGALAAGPGGKMRKMIYPDEDASRMAWEYFRSQLSPFASLAADLVFREDWQHRQLWFSERPQPKRLAAQGIEPWEPGEFWLQQALNIPFQEFVRETWETGYGLSEDQVHTMLKALGSTAFMGLTGGRISKDYALEHAQ